MRGRGKFAENWCNRVGELMENWFSMYYSIKNVRSLLLSFGDNGWLLLDYDKG